MKSEVVYLSWLQSQPPWDKEQDETIYDVHVCVNAVGIYVGANKVIDLSLSQSVFIHVCTVCLSAPAGNTWSSITLAWEEPWEDS